MGLTLTERKAVTKTIATRYARGRQDGLPAAFVFVVGSDVADRLVQTNRIVFSPHSLFGFEEDRVGDGLQVPPLALDVTEEGLDPRLILRLSGRPWCWAIVISAMKAQVSLAVIGGPLSETASRIGRRGRRCPGRAARR